MFECIIHILLIAFDRYFLGIHLMWAYSFHIILICTLAADDKENSMLLRCRFNIENRHKMLQIVINCLLLPGHLKGNI